MAIYRVGIPRNQTTKTPFDYRDHSLSTMTSPPYIFSDNIRLACKTNGPNILSPKPRTPVLINNPLTANNSKNKPRFHAYYPRTRLSITPTVKNLRHNLTEQKKTSTPSEDATIHSLKNYSSTILANHLQVRKIQPMPQTHSGSRRFMFSLNLSTYKATTTKPPHPPAP